ncbi:DUF2019 domain-containing protein [Nitratireductor aquibiodomus]|uniref:DUF2019 domain-containing protein n=1 Tax=Nitratireductor aquibiodomus TaxID=204799 RepID=UPI00046927E2|nr:DUF2019 domain-containing protein [Nitratireductor aquibiodomus]
MAKKGENVSVDKMLQRFIELSLTQHGALLYLETGPYNRAYMKIKKLVEELEARPGDQRHALIDLFDHPNPQVRLNAAKYAHPLFPEESIQVVQSIIDAKKYPQEAHARSALDYLMFGPLPRE